MKSTRRLLIRLIAIAAVIAIAAWMMVIGRGHTIYFDNKPIEANGEKYEAPYQIQVYVDDESMGKLKEGDRGMATTMGQDFKMVLHITPEKDAKKVGSAVSLKIPYNMDGIVINLPALLGGAPEEVYQSEFIPTEVEEPEEEVDISSDEFEMPMGDE
ncbi:MAG: hypothetical protein IJ123_10430 [Blautia sp.]|nr:hypothetical protein [Blautia sp.]